MPTPDNTTEKWQWLAGLCCKNCEGKGGYQMLGRPEPGFGRTCSACKGTGARFPTLRKVCLHRILPREGEGTIWVDARDCEPCHGVGWVLDESKCNSGALIMAMVGMGWTSEHTFSFVDGSFRFLFYYPGHYERDTNKWSRGEDFDAVVLDAVVRALQKEQKP